MHRSIEHPNKFKVLIGAFSAVMLNKSPVFGKPLILSLRAKYTDATKRLVSLLKNEGENVEDAAFELGTSNEDQQPSPLHEGLVELLVHPHPGSDFKDSKNQDFIFAVLHGNVTELPREVVRYLISLADAVIFQSCPEVFFLYC